jgi:hypothetical protein
MQPNESNFKIELLTWIHEWNDYQNWKYEYQYHQYQYQYNMSEQVQSISTCTSSSHLHIFTYSHPNTGEIYQNSRSQSVDMVARI